MPPFTYGHWVYFGPCVLTICEVPRPPVVAVSSEVQEASPVVFVVRVGGGVMRGRGRIVNVGNPGIGRAGR